LPLKAIPSPDLVGDHKEIHGAIVEYEKALATEHEARRTAVQAEQDLGEADHLDALALADATAAGKKDPGDKNRQQQLAAIPGDAPAPLGQRDRAPAGDRRRQRPASYSARSSASR
jgi:hypothetical protein